MQSPITQTVVRRDLFQFDHAPSLFLPNTHWQETNKNSFSIKRIPAGAVCFLQIWSCSLGGFGGGLPSQKDAGRDSRFSSGGEMHG